MKNFYRLFLVLLLAGFCPAAQAASAQSTTLPQVEVTGKQGKASLTVASKADASRDLKRVAGGTSLVDAEDYKTGRSSTLQDTLGYVPGVFAQSRFGAEEARVSIRGSGIQRTFHLRGIKLLQDGVPINQADGGGDFQMIEPLALDYTEVYRGANALQYGGNTLGGAINFVSPTGYDAALVQGRFEAGSYNYLRGQVSSGAVVGPADYYVSLSEFYQDGFRNHSDQDAKRLFSNYGLKITDQLETRFYVTAVDSRSKLPGNLTSAQMNQNPAQNAAANVTGNQKRDFDLVRLANKTTLQLDDEQRFEFGSFYIRKNLYHPIFQVLDVLYHDFGFSTRYVNDKDFLDHKNRFIVGFSPVFGTAADTRSVNSGGARGAQTARSRQNSYNLDFFAEEQFYLFPQFALVSGLQASYASRKVNDRFTSDGDHSAHAKYQAVTPKAGLIYDLTEQSQVYGNFSRSFEPPSFGELTNLTGGRLNDLNAQEASTVELGTRGSEGPVSWDLAWYYSWVENELLGLNDGAGNALGTINAGQTIHQGIEAGFEVDLLKGILPEAAQTSRPPLLGLLSLEREENAEKQQDRLKLRNAYNWSRFRFDGDQAYSENPLPGIPEHFLRAELVYEHPSGLYAGPNIEWGMKKYAVDMANTLFTDPYAILGVKGGFRVNEGLSFFVEGRNLTNQIYAATTGVIADARGRDSAQFLPGDGRSIYAGMEFRWG